MPEEPTKPKSSVIKKLLLVLITIIVLVGLYQWAVHQGDKSQQRFMQKLELGDLMNAEAAKPEPPPAKQPDISIHNAVIEGDIQAVKQHLAAGADVNAKTGDGWTPLHLATTKEVVELLIAKGADVNAKNTNGMTPLHSTAGLGDKEVGGLLIAKGADVNAKSEKGTTPLHYAAIFGHKEIAQLLITKGADVNAEDKVSATPLNFSIFRNHSETADLLRKHGGKTGEELKAEGK